MLGIGAVAGRNNFFFIRETLLARNVAFEILTYDDHYRGQHMTGKICVMTFESKGDFWRGGPRVCHSRLEKGVF
jgi:hypothetical protein